MPPKEAVALATVVATIGLAAFVYLRRARAGALPEPASVPDAKKASQAKAAPKPKPKKGTAALDATLAESAAGGAPRKGKR